MIIEQRHTNQSHRLHDLAAAIAEQGLAPHEAEIVRLANQLRRAGHRHVAIEVALDPTQPSVARERAFGLLHGLALTTAPSLQAAA